MTINNELKRITIKQCENLGITCTTEILEQVSRNFSTCCGCLVATNGKGYDNIRDYLVKKHLAN